MNLFNYMSRPKNIFEPHIDPKKANWGPKDTKDLKNKSKSNVRI